MSQYVWAVRRFDWPSTWRPNGRVYPQAERLHILHHDAVQDVERGRITRMAWGYRTHDWGPRTSLVRGRSFGDTYSGRVILHRLENEELKRF